MTEKVFLTVMWGRSFFSAEVGERRDFLNIYISEPTLSTRKWCRKAKIKLSNHKHIVVLSFVC